MWPLISVVVCTYNRAALLQRAVHSLVSQSFNTSAYEIVIVDNGSTDNTHAVVRAFQGECEHPEIVLTSEPTQGLAYARNTGCKIAKGRYLAFIDDDCIASEDWLETIMDCYERVWPKPSSIGGLILPRYDAPKPMWFKDSYETDTWGDQPRFLLQGESFTGCNMSFRKEVLERLGGFQVNFGMKGERLALAEETQLYRKMWSKGQEMCNLYYTPRAVVYHTIDPYKMSVTYQLKRALMAGQVSCTMAVSECLSRKFMLFVGSIVFLVFRTLLAIFRIARQRSWQNWAVEELYPVASHCGRLLGFCRVNLSFRQRASKPCIPDSGIKPQSSYAS